MKLLKSTSILMLVISATVSCEAPEEKKAETAPPNVENLVSVWNESWNNNDIEAISGLFSDDALLLTSNFVFETKEEIKSNWIQQNAPVMADLNTNILKKGTEDGLVYAAGTYEHNVKTPDTLITGMVGYFTLIWSPDSTGNYLLEFAQIERVE